MYVNLKKKSYFRIHEKARLFDDWNLDEKKRERSWMINQVYQLQTFSLFYNPTTKKSRMKKDGLPIQ